MSDDKPDKPCTLTLADGTHFDLNPLSSAKQDYAADAGTNETVYKLNVCRAVVSELWNIDDPGQVGGFVKREGGEHHGDFSLGYAVLPNTADRTGRSTRISPSHPRHSSR